MKKKGLFIYVLCIMIMLTFTLTGCGGSDEETGTAGEEGKTYKLTFAGQLPSGNAFDTYYFEPFYEKVKEKTNGAVEIEYLPGGALLDGTGMLDGVISGVADIGMIINSYNVGRFPETYFFDLPGLGYKSAKACSYAVKEYIDTYQPEEFQDFVTLSIFGCGFGGIESKTPIHSLEDMKGKQLRSQSAVALGIEALGATPVNMVVGELYEALRSGVVDSNVAVAAAVTDFKLYELVDYMTIYPYFNTTFTVIMNKDSLAELPEDIQTAILEAGQETWEESGSYYFDVVSNKSIEFVKEQGMEVIYLEDAEQARWQEALQPVLEKYAGELDSKGMDGTTILNNVVKLVDKYNEMYPEPIIELEQ